MAVTADESAGRVATARAFEIFYSEEYAGVVRLAVALTGRRAVAEELAQEFFMAAFRRWSWVSVLDDPAGWVRRVAVNRCVSSGRRYVTEVRLLGRLRRERAGSTGTDAHDDELWVIVRGLPKRQAQVLALVFVEDRSVADIASILGCGEETVRASASTHPHLNKGERRE